MFAKARELITSRPAPRLALTVFGCLCAVQTSFAQLERVERAVEDDIDIRISDRVQRHLDQTRDCRVNNDFDCARASLELILSLGSSLSNAERYRYWNSLAYVEFLDGNFAGAAAAYRNVAESSGIPSGIRHHALRSIAQLQASMGQFKEAYETLEELLALKGETPLAGRHLTADGLWQGLHVYVIGTWDLVPLGSTQPIYPAEAVAQGLLGGHVLVEFTVTRTGSTRDVRVIESSTSLFERSAIEAAEKFMYKPRLVDGQPVEVAGVQRRIEFESEDSD